MENLYPYFSSELSYEFYTLLLIYFFLGAKLDYNFPNSNNLAHEAQHVRECILAGKLESPLLSLDESLVIAEIMEDIRKQVGVVYNED